MSKVKARVSSIALGGGGGSYVPPGARMNIHADPGSPAEQLTIGLQVVPDDESEGVFKGSGESSLSLTIPRPAMPLDFQIGETVTITIE